MGKSYPKGKSLFDEHFAEGECAHGGTEDVMGDLESFLDVETMKGTVRTFDEAEAKTPEECAIELELPRYWWTECEGWEEKELLELSRQTKQINEVIDTAMDVIEKYPGYQPLARIGILDFALLCRSYNLAEERRYHLAFVSYLAFLAQTARRFGSEPLWETPEDAFRAFGMQYKMTGAAPFLEGFETG